MEQRIIFAWIYVCKFIQVLQIRIYLKLVVHTITVQRNIIYDIEYLCLIDFKWSEKAIVLVFIIMNI